VQNEFAKLLHRSAKWVGRGRAKGRLYLVAQYPGFVPCENESEWVIGDVYRVHSPHSMYPELDRYEGCGANGPNPHEYRRETVAVQLDSGEWVEACAYVYVRDVRRKRVIASGDYLEADDADFASTSIRKPWPRQGGSMRRGQLPTSRSFGN
jgi:gamma-glutamylcyclotransferase (GGCT)/AIG2-like uncharacterized protein YtfP